MNTQCDQLLISEQPQRFIRIAHQQALGLLVMLKHHLMGFASDARLFVAAKRRMCRVSVITVGPHAPSLNAAPHLIGQITVAAPDTRAQAILRVVRQLQQIGRASCRERVFA